MKFWVVGLGIMEGSKIREELTPCTATTLSGRDSAMC